MMGQMWHKHQQNQIFSIAGTRKYWWGFYCVAFWPEAFFLYFTLKHTQKYLYKVYLSFTLYIDLQE